MKTYKSKGGLVQFKQTYQDLFAGTKNGSTGYCVGCGAEAEGVEPDAVKYSCECCGALKVYGCEELIMMGLYYDAEVAA